ncbi:MAG: hypothetical protein EKK29_10425, partial [Hyphomicrobiales bacterium]
RESTIFPYSAQNDALRLAVADPSDTAAIRQKRGGRAPVTPIAPARHGRACPGHQRRAAGDEWRPVDACAERGHDAVRVVGSADGGFLASPVALRPPFVKKGWARAGHSNRARPSWPGLSRPPTPGRGG